MRLQKEAEGVRSWWEGHFLRELSHSGATRGTVLVVTNSNNASGAKVFALLAKRLQIEGYEPVVLITPKARSAIKAYRAFGVERFAFFDPATAASRTVQRLAQYSEATLLDFQHEGVNIGRTVLNTLVRKTRLGSIDFGPDTIQREIVALLEKSAGLVDELHDLVRSLRPSIAFFQQDRGYSPVGEAFGVCLKLGIPVVPLGSSHRADAFVFKRYTRKNEHDNPYALSDASWQQVLDEPWTPEMDRELMSLLDGGYEAGTWNAHLYWRPDTDSPTDETVRQRFSVPAERKLGVVFPHVLWDAVFFFGESLFANYEDWLFETIRVAGEAPGIDWVIRLHPAYITQRARAGLDHDPDLKQLWSRLGALPSNTHLVESEDPISALSLMKAADVCVTVQGTVGIEAPCRGVPTLTAGTGRNSGRGFTVDSDTQEDYLATVRAAASLPRLDDVTVERARRFAHAVFIRRLWSFDSFAIHRSPARSGRATPPRKTRLRIKSRTELESAHDLRMFAQWMTECDTEDYLARIDVGSLSRQEQAPEPRRSHQP